MPRVEPESKANLVNEYKRSPTTIRRWLNNLRDNYTTFATRFSDNDYLCFGDYHSKNQTLTPLQLKVFKKHYGEP